MPRNMDNVEQSSSKDDIMGPFHNNEESGIASSNDNTSQGGENKPFNEEATSPHMQDASPCISQTAIVETSQNENYDDEPDETIVERLWGLTEMFPESVRNYASKMTTITKHGVSKFYKISCSTAWIIVSSAVVLFAPAVFESERAQVKELQMSQEKQMLLGPAAVLGSKSSKIKGN